MADAQDHWIDGPLATLPAPGDPARGKVDAHLLLTAHFVRTGRVGGAEHMLYNLAQGLAARTRRLSVLCGNQTDLAPQFVRTTQHLLSADVIEAGGSGSRFLAEQRACLDRRVRGDATLFSNYFVPLVVPKKMGRKTVVLHDMQYRHFPQYFSPRKRAWLRSAHHLAAIKADTIVTISEFSRKDAIHWLGQRLERKATVIPNPISWTRFGPPTPGRPLDRPYLLSVAAQYPHKNLEVLVRAFAEVSRRNPDIMLVLCGQDYKGLTGVAGRRAGLGQLIEELGLGRRVTSTGYVDDLTLGQWYRQASGFVFPSLFEGFGMPAVEALGFGLPTLVANATALPETTRGLAAYVADPSSVSEWADHMTKMIRNPADFRVIESDAAMLRAYYDPDRIAALYLDACLR